MGIDLSAVDAARERTERLEAELAEELAKARAAYYSAIKDLVDAHGATAVSQAMGLSRARIYQLIGKLRGR